MTIKNMIEFVRDRLLKQGCKSVNAEGQCLYRSADNHNKCGVGHLIPDELYKPRIENNGISHLWNNSRFNPVKNHIMSTWVEGDLKKEKQLVDTLRVIQSIHDDDEVKRWPSQFKDLLENYS